MLKLIRNILSLQYMLIAIISFILVVNTNFSAINKYSRTDCISGYSLSGLTSVIKSILFAEQECTGNSQDSASSNSPIEEENKTSEEELISHDTEIGMARAFRTRMNHILAQCIKHDEPHIEYLTPPPEV